MKLNVVIGETEVTLGSDDLEYVSQNIILSYVHDRVSRRFIFMYEMEQIGLHDRRIHGERYRRRHSCGGEDVVSHVVDQFSLYHQRHP
jgi:hypothetical protein